MHPNHPLKRTHHVTVIFGVLLSTLLGLGVLAYSFVIVANLASRDELPPDTNDIALVAHTYTADQNGYPAMIAAITQANLTATDRALIQGIVEAQDWNSADAKNLTAKYATTLETIRGAIQSQILEDPAYATEASTIDALHAFMTSASPQNEAVSIRSFADLLMIHARQVALAGDMSAGLREAATVAQLGQKLARGRSLLISNLSQENIYLTGLDAFRTIASSAKASAATINAAAALLPDGNMLAGIMESFQIETSPRIRNFSLQNIIPGTLRDWLLAYTDAPLGVRLYYFLSLGSTETNFVYHPNETTRLLANQLRANLVQLAQPCTSTSHTATRPAALTPLEQLTTPNAIGLDLVRNLWLGDDGLWVRRCNMVAAVELSKTLAAVRTYERVTGKLPTTLDALVPTYLPLVPTDPYSGKAVQYDPSARFIFSVGADHKARAGDPNESLRSSRQPTLAIPTNSSTTAVIPTSAQTNVYYIAVGDDGKTGSKIGCGDSVIPVKKVAATSNLMVNEQVEAALGLLLADHSATLGESGLTNALANSRLTIDTVSLVQANGKVDNTLYNWQTTTVRVALKGTISSGGTCDDPRITAQLTSTIRQFAPENPLQVTVNGKSLASVLSAKGQ